MKNDTQTTAVCPSEKQWSSPSYRESTYLKVALYWHKLGITVIPGDREKVPTITFKTLGCISNPEYVPESQLRAWDRQFPGATPLLLTSSGRFFNLVVIDDDSGCQGDWIQTTFGPTPYVVATGREGGGHHHYYLIPLGWRVSSSTKAVGPNESVKFELDAKGAKTNNWGKTQIDVKSHGSYVVAPGATHKTGRVYTPNLNLESLDLAWYQANLPVFRPEAYDEAKRSHKALVEAHTIYEVAPAEFEEPEGESKPLAGVPEPFMTWCENNVNELGYEMRFLLATNLRRIFRSNQEGFAELRRIVSGRCDESESLKEWAKVSRKPSAAGYRALRSAGYTGLVPRGYKSPADYVAAQKRSSDTQARGYVELDIKPTSATVKPPTPTAAPTPMPPRPVMPERAKDAIERQLDREYAEERRAKRSAHFRDRVEARITKNTSVPTVARTAAERVIQEANASRMESRVRKSIFAAGGITPAPCGVTLLGLNVGDESVVGWHTLCGNKSCFRCGPEVIAHQWAAVCYGPRVLDGKIVSPCLVDLGIAYEYAMNSEAEFKSFRDRIAPTCMANPLSSIKQEGLSIEIGGFAIHVGQGITDPLWFRFDTEGGIRVLSSVPVRPSRKSNSTTLVYTHRDWEAVMAAVTRLVFSTYRVSVGSKDMTLDFGEQDATSLIKPRVYGKITSVHGHTLDPAAQKTKASKSDTACLGMIPSVRAAHDAAIEVGLGVKSCREHSELTEFNDAAMPLMTAMRSNPTADLYDVEAMMDVLYPPSVMPDDDFSIDGVPVQTAIIPPPASILADVPNIPLHRPKGWSKTSPIPNHKNSDPEETDLLDV